MAYKYDCFITYHTKYGLLDDSGELRCTAPDLDGIVERKAELGWGKIIRVKLTKKGVTFGGEVK